MRPEKNLTFSQALCYLKEGDKLARANWNGKNMYITLKPGYLDGIECNATTAKAHGIPEGTKIIYRPFLEMKTAENDFVPWLASQTDLLSDDWFVVK